MRSISVVCVAKWYKTLNALRELNRFARRGSKSQAAFERHRIQFVYERKQRIVIDGLQGEIGSRYDGIA